MPVARIDPAARAYASLTVRVLDINVAGTGRRVNLVADIVNF
jgi:hypothetical protein